MRRSVPPTALAVACGLAIAFQLRSLLVAPPGWITVVGATAACAAAAWAIRLLPAGPARIAGAAAAAIAALAVAVRIDAGRWPGADGASSAPHDVAASLGAMGRGWARVVFPVAQAAEPRAVAAVLALGLALSLTAAVAVIAFRTPLPAILAVAIPTGVATLFIGTPRPAVHAAVLVVLAVALLLLVGDAPRGRDPLALGAVALAAGLALLLGLGSPLAARDAAWDWQDWSFADPQPVDVALVWDQTLGPIAFAGDPVPVLRVDRRDSGYLRVAVLSRFDGVTWGRTPTIDAATAPGGFALPRTAVPSAARRAGRSPYPVHVVNLRLRSDELPLPIGTVRVDGLPAATAPVRLAADGTVRLGAVLPLDARYTAETVRVPSTPQLLDADVLGAAADPTAIVAGAIPSTGRNADQDPAAPWSAGADARAAAQQQPGPYGAVATDANTPARRPVAGRVVQPDPADVAIGGVAFPAFGQPGRDRVVRRILRQQAWNGLGGLPFVGWQRVYRIARRVTRGATTPYEAAVLLEDWFQRTSTYDERASYTSSPIGALPQFVLARDRRGHCQYFAGAMAAMLRLLGVPARLAVGFTAGSPEGDGRVITDRDAHAWVEVRFPTAGWVPFEPTPGRALPAATSSTSPSFARSAAGVGGAALAGVVGRQVLPGGPEPHAGAARSTATPAATDGRWPGRAPLLAALALATLALALTGVWARKRLRVRAAFRREDPGAAARALRDVVAGWIGDQDGEAPGDVAAVARSISGRYAVDAAAWADALLRAGYAPPAEARRAVADARRETRAVIARMRERSDRRERLRGAVRLRRARR